MGIKKTLTPIYGRNGEGQRVQIGHKLNGVFIPLGKELTVKPVQKPTVKTDYNISTEKPKETVSRVKFSSKKK